MVVVGSTIDKVSVCQRCDLDGLPDSIPEDVDNCIVDGLSGASVKDINLKSGETCPALVTL